jgi:hypothetical protein
MVLISVISMSYAMINTAQTNTRLSSSYKYYPTVCWINYGEHIWDGTYYYPESGECEPSPELNDGSEVLP